MLSSRVVLRPLACMCRDRHATADCRSTAYGVLYFLPLFHSSSSSSPLSLFSLPAAISAGDMNGIVFHGYMLEEAIKVTGEAVEGSKEKAYGLSVLHRKCKRERSMLPCHADAVS